MSMLKIYTVSDGCEHDLCQEDRTADESNCITRLCFEKKYNRRKIFSRRDDSCLYILYFSAAVVKYSKRRPLNGWNYPIFTINMEISQMGRWLKPCARLEKLRARTLFALVSIADLKPTASFPDLCSIKGPRRKGRLQTTTINIAMTTRNFHG